MFRLISTWSNIPAVNSRHRYPPKLWLPEAEWKKTLTGKPRGYKRDQSRVTSIAGYPLKCRAPLKKIQQESNFEDVRTTKKKIEPCNNINIPET